MNIVRFMVECVGWVVVSPLVAVTIYILTIEFFSCIAGRWHPFPHLWRIGFYARRSDYLPSSLQLVGDHRKWTHVWDRWYWRQ